MSDATNDRSRRPNVVMIIYHDMGDWLGCYDRPWLRTPVLDGVAASGVRVANQFASCPICGPSRAGIYSGCHPATMNIYGNSHYLPAGEPRFFSARLKESGYRTRLCQWLQTNGNLEWAGYDDRVPIPKTEEEFAGFWEEMRGDGSQPFFAHFSQFTAHRPFGTDHDPDLAERIEVPPRLPDHPLTRKDLATQARQSENADAEAGRILRSLEAAGLAEDTLVIVTTEHGVAQARAKHTLYDPGIHTFLLMRWPGKLPEGKVVGEMVSNVDFLPTVLELLDIEASGPIQGRSYLPAIRGEAYEPRDAVFSAHTWGQRRGLQYYTPMRCIRTERYKLIRNYDEQPFFVDTGWLCRFQRHREVVEEWPLFGKPAPEYELYDLEKDPHELENLAEDPALRSVRDDLAARLETHLRECDDEILTGAVETKKDSPLFQQWWRPENYHTRQRQEEYRLLFDPHSEDSEEMFEDA